LAGRSNPLVPREIASSPDFVGILAMTYVFKIFYFRKAFVSFLF